MIMAILAISPTTLPTSLLLFGSGPRTAAASFIKYNTTIISISPKDAISNAVIKLDKKTERGVE